MQQLVLAATDLGLGTCWIGAFDEAKVKNLLEVPENDRVVALIPLWYPAEKEGFGSSLPKSLLGLIRESLLKRLFTGKIGDKIGNIRGDKGEREASGFRVEKKPTKENNPEYDVIYGPFMTVEEAQGYIKAIEGLACGSGGNSAR